jgi:hypothetical protein
VVFKVFFLFIVENCLILITVSVLITHVLCKVTSLYIKNAES